MTESEFDKLLKLLNIELPRLSREVEEAIDAELDAMFGDDNEEPIDIDEWGVMSFGEDFLH